MRGATVKVKPAIQDSMKDTLARITARKLAAIYSATGRAQLANRYRELAGTPP